jgi:dolichol kinase
MAAFWPALLLPYVTPGQAMGISFGLVLMNVILLPRYAPSLYRAREKGRGALEIILYPIAVMATIAAFGWLPSNAGDMVGESLPGKPPWYLPIAIAWFGLACVDACIGLACRLFPNGPAFPWNRRKPILAVAIGAIAACFPAWLLIQFTLPSTLKLWGWGWGWPWFLGLLIFCALVETVWFGIADNIVIPFSLSVAISFLPSPPLFLSSGPVTWVEIPGFWNGPVFAILVSVGFGLAAYSARLLTMGGSLLGGILALILMHGNPWLFAFLSGFFL